MGTVSFVGGIRREKLRDPAVARAFLPVISGPSSQRLDNHGLEGRATVRAVRGDSGDGIRHFWASELFFARFAGGHPRHVDLLWFLWNFSI